MRVPGLLGSTAAVALALAGCGSGAATPARNTKTVPAARAQLHGADYALALAPGWRDTTTTHHQAKAVDREISEHSPRAVAVISRVRPPAGVATSKVLRDTAARELAGARATAHTSRRPLTLDGAQAITYQFRATSKAGARIQARQVLAVHGGRIHVITMIASRARFQAADAALGAMLASWRWTGG